MRHNRRPQEHDDPPPGIFRACDRCWHTTDSGAQIELLTDWRNLPQHLAVPVVRRLPCRVGQVDNVLEHVGRVGSACTANGASR